MGTYIAQILIGRSHCNHGGINPSHRIYFYVNGRAALMLFQDYSEYAPPEALKTTWIIPPENELKSALLMIAVHVVKDPEILELAKSFYPDILSDYVEIHERFRTSELEELYEKCNQIKGWPKLVISNFEGQFLLRQLPILEDYDMELEVCVSIYSRYCPWGELITKGSLHFPVERDPGG